MQQNFGYPLPENMPYDYQCNAYGNNNNTTTNHNHNNSVHLNQTVGTGIGKFYASFKIFFHSFGFCRSFSQQTKKNSTVRKIKCCINLIFMQYAHNIQSYANLCFEISKEFFSFEIIFSLFENKIEIYTFILN